MEKIFIVYRDGGSQKPAAQVDHPALAKRLAPHCYGASLYLRGKPISDGILPADQLEDSIGAVCSVWLSGADRLPDVLPHLNFLGQPYGIYVVSESVSLPYSKVSLKVGEQVQGASIFAMMRKKSEHTLDEFYRRWTVHAGISLRLHPLIRYYRSLTVRTVAGADRWDAFTEESVAVDEDMRPDRFCPEGESALKMTYEDMLGFLNIPQDIRATYLREHVLKLPCWLSSAAGR